MGEKQKVTLARTRAHHRRGPRQEGRQVYVGTRSNKYMPGMFGTNTEKVLKDWQTTNGLAADGVAGPDTFMAMGLYELVLLKQGTRGDSVRKLQEALGISADGQFGPGTEKAVRDYQQKNGLQADGMAGTTTLAQMKLFKEITADTVISSQVAASTIVNPVASAKVAAADAGGGLRSVWDTVKSAFK